SRLNRGLDLLDTADDLLDLRSRRMVEERDARAGPGRVACSSDALRVAVRDEPEDERVHRIDMRAEGTREADPLDALDAVALHEQRAPGVQRRLRELDLAHVVLRDHELRLTPPEDI